MSFGLRLKVAKDEIGCRRPTPHASSTSASCSSASRNSCRAASASVAMAAPSGDPMVFLFDEPLSNLDQVARADAHRDQRVTRGDHHCSERHHQVEAMTLPTAWW
jgi:hypothetical protein